jgi:hypothetical protein
MGGQLALVWNLRVIVKFSSGLTVLIPSAIVTHSNCPISEEEDHFSITQFCAADLFTWVENGFKNDFEVE